MTVPQDAGMQELLHAVVAKQDHLEKRLEAWHSTILGHLTGLCPSQKVWPHHPNLSGCTRPSSGDELHASSSSNLVPVKQASDKSNGCVTSVTDCTTSVASATGGSSKQDQPETPSNKKIAYQKTLSLNAAALQVLGSSASFNMSESRPKCWRAFSYDEWMAIQEAEDNFMGRISTGSLRVMRFSNSTFKRLIRAISRSCKITLFGTIKSNEPCLANVVRHPLFQCVCGTMVFTSCCLIGITVDAHANSVLEGNSAHAAEILSHVCSTFFVVELLLRVMAFGVRDFFLQSEERWINVFDTLIVGLSVCDTTLSILSNNELSTVSTLKVFRIFRIFRFVRELSLMVFMICECLTSLFWAIVLLMLIMYAFAAIFTQSATIYRKREDGNLAADIDSVELYFGTMARTCYYLFQAMLGGISWGVVSDTLFLVDRGSTILFFFYIAFTMLCVLNIITGIFVDNALETSRMQREYIVKRQEKAKTRTMKQLVKIFDEMDEDGSGALSWDEMEAALDCDAVAKYFAALGLQCGDAIKLFDMMDEDKSGQVNLQEFLDGCSRYTGDAKSIDIHAILHSVKRLQDCLILEEQRSSNNIHYVKAISEEMREALTVSLRAYDSQFKQLNDLSKRIIQKFDTEDAAYSAEQPHNCAERNQLTVGDAHCSSLESHPPKILRPASLPPPQSTPAEWTSPSSLHLQMASN